MFEKQFFKPVYDALQAQIKDFVDKVNSEGLAAAERSLHQSIGNEDIAKAVRDLWLKVGLYFAQNTTLGINASEKKGFGFNKKWINDIIEFLREYLLSAVVIPVSETTKKQIFQLLGKAQQEGWGIYQIVSELENSDITRKRAEMIVRTELVRAMNKGQELAKQDSKWELADTWLAVKDTRTRHSHMIMDGATINPGQLFKVPIFKKVGGVDIEVGHDLMTGPGDPTASAGNVINCRCTKVSRVARDQNGVPIRKKTFQLN